MRKFVAAATAAIALTAGLSACGKPDHPDTPKFRAAIEQSLSASSCLEFTGFPQMVDMAVANDPVVVALSAVGYMTRTSSPGGRSVELDLEQKAWDAGVFDPLAGKICAGQKRLVEIDQADIVDVTKGRSVVVGYSWQYADLAPWAKGLRGEGFGAPAKDRITLESDGAGGWRTQQSIQNWVKGRF